MTRYRLPVRFAHGAAAVVIVIAEVLLFYFGSLHGTLA
jgi:hypothetical protein